jgi:hypothetical protein
MQIMNLPPQGTLVLIQGGLALLGAAFAAKWAVTRFLGKKASR